MKISDLVQVALDKHYGNFDEGGQCTYLCHAINQIDYSGDLVSRAKTEVIDYIESVSPSGNDTIMGHLRCDDPVYAKIIGADETDEYEYDHHTPEALAYRVEFIKRMIASFKERGI